MAELNPLFSLLAVAVLNTEDEFNKPGNLTL